MVLWNSSKYGIYSAFVPLQMTLIMTNIADAQTGKPLTYLTITFSFTVCIFLVVMVIHLDYVYRCLQREVRRYKKMLKLAFILICLISMNH